MKCTLALFLCGILFVCASFGCAWSVGGRKGHVTTPPTQGQELIDLKRALQLGAIDQADYDAQKKNVLERK